MQDFMEMEMSESLKIEVTNKSVFDLLSKTTEYLQPNPASRAKLGMLNTVSKIRGQVKTTGYPQTEGLLGDTMLRYGHELGEESAFGSALVDMGDGMRQMADVKDALDINVKQNFIDPLQNFQDKDLKEIMAVEKFEESKDLAERSMFNFLENDVEQVSQLSALIEAALEYHRQSSQILEELSGKLQARIAAAGSRPKREFKPKSIMSNLDGFEGNPHNGLSYSSSIKSKDIQISQTVNGKGQTLHPIHVVINSLIHSSYSSHFVSILFVITCQESNKNVTGTVYTARGYSCYPIFLFNSISVSLSSLSLSSAPPGGAAGGSEVPDQPCCRCLYNFEPENAGELGFKEGDVIILTNQIDENWYEGMISGESGFFPINYVEVIVPLPQ
ncbi:hypothetical protein CRUP_036108 [Coryphaenoides rupestris]|nr:hypothetical protein CRUP_036108 [Coryphaenoides rupestris]